MRKLKPVFGYLHRNHEKIGENASYLGSMPYTDRLDYFCSMTNNWAYALSVEKLAGIEVPERAEYLRVIPCGTDAVANHACCLGFLLSDMGAWGTPLMYAFREREKILDLFESLSGSRMMCDYMRFGGCRVDADDEWLGRAKTIVDRFPKFLDEFEQLIFHNEIVIARTQNVGKLSADLAISAGITGPMLRACGVNYDIRKVDGYGIYPRFKFRVPLGDHGDTYDRLMMRALEMRESIGILNQAFEQIPAGPDHESESKDPRLQTAGGEAYGRIEGPERRTRFLFDQRWRRESVSLSRATTELHQSHHSRRFVSRSHRGRRDGDSWRLEYFNGEGGSMIGTGILKGMAVTARNFVGSYFEKDRLTTVQYPEERIPLAENYRNFPFLVYDNDPEAGLRCVACKICEKECPPQCIYIIKSEDKKPDYMGKPQFYPAIFDIDISVCMSCQICVEVCPFEAIKMDKVFELSRRERFDALLQRKGELSKSNTYYHSIHPIEAAEVDANLAEAAAKKKPAPAATPAAAAPTAQPQPTPPTS